MNKIAAPIELKINVKMNYCYSFFQSGKTGNKAILRTFIKTPLTPCPTLTIPIYYGGKMAALLKTWDATKPVKVPKRTNIPKHDQQLTGYVWVLFDVSIG